MGRYRRTTSSAPLAALAGLLLLIGVSHCRAAARPLLPSPPLLHHLHGNGVKDAADVPVLQEGVAGNGDELSTSEMMGGAEEVDEEAMASCEEGDDECVQQRRLLRDAHLDYIYTQHKGKP